MSDALTGPVGTVSIGGLAVTIAPISLIEERAMRRAWKAGARAHAAEHFKRESLVVLKMFGEYPQAAEIAVRELVRLKATEAPDDTGSLYWEYRQSPAAIAIELFARGRFTPDLTPGKLTAVLTEANVDQVAEDLALVLRPPAPKPEAGLDTPAS